MRHGCWSCLQVYDLQDHRPGPVLKAIFSNLDAAAAAGDTQVQLRCGACDAGPICTGVALQTAVQPHSWRLLHSKNCRLDSRLSGKAVTADAGSILSCKLEGSRGWRRRHSRLDSGHHCRAGPQSGATRRGVPQTPDICCGRDQGLTSANDRQCRIHPWMCTRRCCPWAPATTCRSPSAGATPSYQPGCAGDRRSILSCNTAHADKPDPLHRHASARAVPRIGMPPATC